MNGTSSPVKLGDLGDVRSVSAGRSFFLADDGAYSAGSNEFGQLCVDATEEEGESRASVPTKLDVEGRIVVAFESIRSSSYIVFEDGTVNGCDSNRRNTE